ncbi:hypothetical protein LCGC14_2200430, partial [marine sediment metagenome]
SSILTVLYHLNPSVNHSSILIKAFKKGKQLKIDNKCYIGISAPGHYSYSEEILSIITLFFLSIVN